MFYHKSVSFHCCDIVLYFKHSALSTHSNNTAQHDRKTASKISDCHPSARPTSWDWVETGKANFPLPSICDHGKSKIVRNLLCIRKGTKHRAERQHKGDTIQPAARLNRMFCCLLLFCIVCF